MRRAALALAVLIATAPAFAGEAEDSRARDAVRVLSLIHISEPTRRS